jgi:hypothetical protein
MRPASSLALSSDRASRVVAGPVPCAIITRQSRLSAFLGLSQGEGAVRAGPGIGDDQLDAPQTARRANLRRNSVQKVSTSERQISMPRTSWRPWLLTPHRHGHRDRDDAAALTHLQ